MSIFIELDEFKNKYNISDMLNKKLVKMSIKKEFPEFEELHSEWSMEDRYLKIDFYEKEVWIKKEELKNYEEKCKNKILELIQKTAKHDPFLIKDLSSKIGIPENKFLELSLERLKVVFGSYSNALLKLQDENFMKEIVDKFSRREV